MIITDENLHGALVKALIEQGYEVKPVAKTNQGATDEAVIVMAFDEAALLARSFFAIKNPLLGFGVVPVVLTPPGFPTCFPRCLA